MGMLMDGKWTDKWYDTASTGGRFVRSAARFRDQITADGSSGFRAEAGRYHIYVSPACPWSHRVMIYRAILGLQDVVSLSTVEPLMRAHGWEFSSRRPDPIGGAEAMWQVYTRAAPDYSGRVTVPVVWDRERDTIVSNESSEIIRFLQDAFVDLGSGHPALYPAALRGEIDALNARIYDDVNNGVYRAGFATTQAAYDEAVKALFATLAALERRLRGQAWLLGETLTEADWRLFVTLVRFDAVYHGHFKCNLARLIDMPALWDHTRRLYHRPGVAETVRLEETRLHYYGSHAGINPSGVVPIGPAVTFPARGPAVPWQPTSIG